MAPTATPSETTAPLDPNDAVRPSVTEKHISFAFKGDKLSKPAGNWKSWNSNIRDDLDMMALGQHITKDGSWPPDRDATPNAYRNWMNNDRVVMGYIRRNCDEPERELISELKTAWDCWEKLRTHNEDEGPIKQVNLIQSALSTRISRDETMVTKARQLREDVRRAFRMPGGINEDTFVCIALLNSLSVGHEHTRAIVQRDLGNATKSKPYSSDNLIRQLEQDRDLVVGDKQRNAAEAQTLALAATMHNHQGTKGRTNIFCGNCHKPGHTSDFCIREGGGMAGKSIEESKAARQAMRKKSGSPTAKPSLAPAKVNVKGPSGDSLTLNLDATTFSALLAAANANTAAPEFAGLASECPTPSAASSIEVMEYEGWLVCDEEPMASIDWNTHSHAVDISAFNATSLNQKHRTEVLSLDVCPFYVDTGATIHISPAQSDFLNLRSIMSRSVKGVGGSAIMAVGVGDIKLRIARGTHLVLRNALFVPNATVRLISVSSLTRDSNAVAHFDDASCWLDDRSTGALIARGHLLPSKNLYTLDLAHPDAEHALTATHLPNIDTWHRRLGHANYQALMDMARNGLVDGMPTRFPSHNPKCDSCILGKQTRTPVPKVRSEEEGHGRAKGKLEKIWVDLSGPHDVVSRTGNRYIMNIVDDFTAFVWTIPLKNKSEAFQQLKAWEIARERETGEKVGIYRTDNGELKSQEMEVWLISRGTDHQFTAPYTSAHIGRVERMHRTLMGKARTMRIQANLPPNLWDEMYLTAAHLHVKTTSRSTPGKTPWELWYGRRPSYGYMREIGCRAFILIQNRNNPKIYERSVECVLIGYDSRSKTYRCYHRASHRVFSSYHVRFLESHEAAPPTKPLPQSAIPLTLNDIAEGASTTPIFFDEDEDEDILPSPFHPSSSEPIVSINPDIVEAPTVNVNAQDQIEPPRRSSRLSTAAAQPKGPSKLEVAVEQSREAAERLKASRTERRKDLRDIRRQEESNQADLQEEDAVADLLGLLGQLDNTSLVDRVLATMPASELDPRFFEDDRDPKSWKEAKLSSESVQWREGYQEELQSLKDMKVYRLVPRSSVPAGRKIYKGRPVFRRKQNEKGETTRYKVRLVFKGFEQIYGRDYTRTTSPTARMESWRILLHIAAVLGWDAQQIDVKTAFLYGLLPDDETQYMEQPEDFVEPGFEDHVWLLERSLYGMKQAGRIWNQTMDTSMRSWGFKRLSSESCIYYRKQTTGIVISAVHVDDFLTIASSPSENEQFKRQMRSQWTISELGEPKYVVGIAIQRDKDTSTISLSQTALIDKVVTQFGQQDAYPVLIPMDPGLKLRRPPPNSVTSSEREQLAKLPYRSLVGCLIYLAVATRPDISYAVQQLSQFLDCYTYSHWNAAIKVVRYLKGSRDLKLTLGRSPSHQDAIDLLGFTDSDWANCLDTRRSVGGYCFSLGSGLVSWSSKKQKTVASSSCEAEYTAAFESAKEAIWLRALLAELDTLNPSHPTRILCDNNAAISLSEDPSLHSRVKHVDIHYHFLRERVNAGQLTLSYINTKDNIADIFTKALPRAQFTRLRSLAGLQ